MFDGDDRASLEMLTGKREDGEHDVCSFGGPPSAAAQQDDAWLGGASQGEEGAEVGVGGDDHAIVVGGFGEQRFVGSAAQGPGL